MLGIPGTRGMRRPLPPPRPPIIVRIILLAWSNSLSRELTCWVVVPLPLPGPGEEDRAPGDAGDGERGAAPSVAVELREDEPRGVDLAHERLGLDDGVLAGHGVACHQHVVRLDLVADPSSLAHHVRV